MFLKCIPKLYNITFTVNNVFYFYVKKTFTCKSINFYFQLKDLFQIFLFCYYFDFYYIGMYY